MRAAPAVSRAMGRRRRTRAYRFSGGTPAFPAQGSVWGQKTYMNSTRCDCCVHICVAIRWSNDYLCKVRPATPKLMRELRVLPCRLPSPSCSAAYALAPGLLSFLIAAPGTLQRLGVRLSFAAPAGIAKQPASRNRMALRFGMSRLEHAMDDREQELKDVPLRAADKSTWPKGIRSISYDEVDALGVDPKGELYWQGKPVKIRRPLDLTCRLRLACRRPARSMVRSGSMVTRQNAKRSHPGSLWPEQALDLKRRSRSIRAIPRGRWALAQ